MKSLIYCPNADCLYQNPIGTELCQRCHTNLLSNKSLERVLKTQVKDIKTGQTITKDISVDYTKLRELLASQQWLEADIETATIMIQIAGKERQGYLESDDIQNFPCTELNTINQLWLDFSKGKFGFSTQRQIWLECGGTAGLHKWTNEDYNICGKFAERIGWSKWGNFLRHYDLTFDINAPVGHLPLYYWVKANKNGDAYRNGIDISSLVFRLDACQI